MKHKFFVVTMIYVFAAAAVPLSLIGCPAGPAGSNGDVYGWTAWEAHEPATYTTNATEIRYKTLNGERVVPPVTEIREVPGTKLPEPVLDWSYRVIREKTYEEAELREYFKTRDGTEITDPADSDYEAPYTEPFGLSGKEEARLAALAALEKIRITGPSDPRVTSVTGLGFGLSGNPDRPYQYGHTPETGVFFLAEAPSQTTFASIKEGLEARYQNATNPEYIVGLSYPFISINLGYGDTEGYYNVCVTSNYIKFGADGTDYDVYSVHYGSPTVFDMAIAIVTDDAEYILRPAVRDSINRAGRDWADIPPLATLSGLIAECAEVDVEVAKTALANLGDYDVYSVYFRPYEGGNNFNSIPLASYLNVFKVPK